MNTNKNNAQVYLSKVIARLKDKGFSIYENVEHKNQVFEYVAKKTKFEIESFGFATTFFLFAGFSTPDVQLLSDFTTKSFHYARKASGIHPPRGLLFSIVCFPVAIADSIDNDTAEAIRKRKFPKHWAASEKLVVFNLELKTLYYSETAPMWGAMYHDKDRQTINEMLAP